MVYLHNTPADLTSTLSTPSYPTLPHSYSHGSHEVKVKVSTLRLPTDTLDDAFLRISMTLSSRKVREQHISYVVISFISYLVFIGGFPKPYGFARSLSLGPCQSSILSFPTFPYPSIGYWETSTTIVWPALLLIGVSPKADFH